MYYLIETEYAGPDQRYRDGGPLGDTRRMEIRTGPGRRNGSHEVCTDGWLGTTRDVSQTAHGEYETLALARAEAHDMGYSVQLDEDHDLYVGHYPDVIEQWVSAAAARSQWDAGYWLMEQSAEDLGITSYTSDEDLDMIADQLGREALADDIELHGTREYLETLLRAVLSG